jgi:hypothetical protein
LKGFSLSHRENLKNSKILNGDIHSRMKQRCSISHLNESVMTSAGREIKDLKIAKQEIMLMLFLENMTVHKIRRFVHY